MTFGRKIIFEIQQKRKIYNQKSYCEVEKTASLPQANESEISEGRSDLQRAGWCGRSMSYGFLIENSCPKISYLTRSDINFCRTRYEALVEVR